MLVVGFCLIDGVSPMKVIVFTCSSYMNLMHLVALELQILNASWRVETGKVHIETPSDPHVEIESVD